MTDKTKPISASNPPESRGNRDNLDEVEGIIPGNLTAPVEAKGKSKKSKVVGEELSSDKGGDVAGVSR